jgi:hypothetical protein
MGPLFEIIDDIFAEDEGAFFMRAYFDESGKHDQAKVISIFGLLMSIDTCKELQRKWFKEASRSPEIPLPFHMSDCIAGSKNFAPFDDDTRLEMQRRMISTLKGLDLQAYGASVIRGDYDKVVSHLRPDQNLRNPWYLAFEGGIGAMMKASAQAGKNHTVTFVFDRQPEYADKAHSLFNELLASQLSYADRLGTLSFSPKDKVAALQAIDVIVNEVNRRWTDRHLSERWQHKLIRDLISVKGALFDSTILQSMIKGA